MNAEKQTRDDKFYFSDGNMTILVSNILFRVHQHVLARDGSTFETMFSAKKDAHEGPECFKEEGEDDEHPIQLFDDDINQFRDLLWSLYALPQEIAVAMSSKHDAAKLANVACMAHKYNFVTTETWALKGILSCLRDKTVLDPLSTQDLVQITRAASLSQDVHLLDIVRKIWKGSIMEGRDLGATLVATERLGMADLVGLAYHAILLQGRQFWEEDPSLTREQRIRLLSGYLTLTEFCDDLPDNAPSFQHIPSCWDTDECNERWMELWKLINSPDPAYGIGIQALRHHKLDILGRARMAVSIMVAVVSRSFPGRGDYGRTRELVEDFVCAERALDATAAFSRQLQSGMLDFFPEVK
ncbi:hypothetical protein CPC08DRAFT_631715 [Agrocybe pediades]|nr:hypothetical protein CPC08DRAFT_631715 [Agrocybe pediades]